MRVLEGRFGRLVLSEVTSGERLEASADPAILLQQGLDEVVFLNATESHVVEFAVPAMAAEPPAIEVPAPPSVTRLLAFHAASDWLRGGFPAVFEDARPFPQPREPMTPRLRQLAEALAVDVLNDRFLSTERIEFMLQELLLSIVETYLARRRASSPLWRGSRFEDSRIRRALALLRARPNKDLNMDHLANQVGLSRSRFYDLFQVCTGFSPRAYLDMLCVETAIQRLSYGRGKIAEVANELGFSAQSNFTRFFLNQVGVPPSEYRRATSDAGAQPPKPQD